MRVFALPENVGFGGEAVVFAGGAGSLIVFAHAATHNLLGFSRIFNPSDFSTKDTPIKIISIIEFLCFVFC